MCRALASTLLISVLAAPASAQGYVAAEGGGSITGGTWAQSVFGWMLSNAGGPGRVVILGVSGQDAAAGSAFLAAGASSVQQLAIPQGAADLQSTFDAIVAADVVWMRGGDQSRYVEWWNGTATEAAIRQVFDSGGAVGGTSAGCAVLGEWIFDALSGSLGNSEALRNPASPKFSFTDDFLELVPGVLFDTHFTERGRLARLGVQLARLRVDTGLELQGIGVDDRTAFCVSPDGTAEVIGEGAVTLLSFTDESRVALQPNRAPLITDLQHVQLTEGYRYDLGSRSVVARPANAILTPAPSGSPEFQQLLLAGSSASDASRGEVQVLDGGDDAALFFGALQVVPGTGDLTRTVVSTRTWDSTTWDENRVGGPQYALALAPHGLALLLDGGTRVASRPDERLTVFPANGAEPATVLLDTWGVESVAFSTYLSSGGADGPRQSVALEGATLHFLPSGATFDALAHAVTDFSPVGTGTPGCAGPVVLSAAGSTELGGMVQLTSDPAAPFVPGWLLLGAGPDLAGSDPLGLGPITHVDLFVGNVQILSQPADDAGQGRLDLQVPNEPALAGRTFWTQSFFVAPGCGVGSLELASSNGLGLTLH